MKYLKYILIIIALVGILNLAKPIQAVEQIGQCALRKADGNIIPQGQMTYEECKKRATPGESAPIWEIIAKPYTLLAPLPCPTPGSADCNGNGQFATFDPSEGNLGKYLNIMIKILIGVAAVLSVVMIVVGGLEVMTSELAHTKEAGKERITHAILGLLIALGAYALLFTINPDLLKSDVAIPGATGEGTTLGFKGNCIVTNKGININLQTTQENCELNPNSQSWQGIPTGNAKGLCIFRKASDLVRTEAQTTKTGCELNGDRMISWTINPS